MSVNGPELTIIEWEGPIGQNAARGAYVAENATLSGFTLRDGAQRLLSGRIFCPGTECRWRLLRLLLVVGCDQLHPDGQYGRQ
jgi:hypothetical protein